MVGREITPTDIGKHSKLIKAAQEEMAIMDVLVCGRCLTVFHFIEEFRQHKQKPCHKETNNVRECNDTKPKIWAFLLWKATQLNNNKETNSTSPNSWSLYQTWVKMEESIRETWIVAGKTIQSFAKIGQGGLQEMPVKITKTVVNNNPDGAASSPGRKPLAAQSKPLVANLKPPVKLPVASKAHDSENETSPIKTTSNSSAAINAAIAKVVKKPVGTPTVVGANKINTSTPLNKPTSLSRRAKRTVPNSNEITEESVEKIVAKRFNPRRKMHEYLVKWEGRLHEQNTWEPAVHLDNVPQILETFEKQLARQKETRAALQAKQQAANLASAVKVADVNKKETSVASNVKSGIAMNKLPTLNTDTSDSANKSNLASPAGSDSSRLARNSKVKAMDQVKQWCAGGSTGASSPGSTAGDNATNNACFQEDKDWSMNTSSSSVGATGGVIGGIKRKLDDSDFNDSTASDVPSTTATMEDLEEDLIPSHTVKRMKNGNAVSVEVKTKTVEKNVESKVIKVNGTAENSVGSITGESLAVGPNSAEVIITQDTSASGVVKKPGHNGNSNSNSQKTEAQIRVLSKGEAAVSNSGIVHLSGGSNTDTNSSSSGISTDAATTQTKTTITSRPQQIRVGGTSTTIGQSAGRQTTNIGSTQITTISQRAQLSGPQRTPSGTTIQRKPNALALQQRSALQSQARTTSMQQRTTISSSSGGTNQTSPSSGRMIIPRTGAGSALSRPTSSVSSKNVTPEQKILQLSKSGDLKVTKKVMTREDAVAHRQQQARQQQLQARQQQSHVQIQKVQQIAPPSSRSTSISVRKSQSDYDDNETSHATLCPITGKILGQDDHSEQQLLVQQQHLQSGVLQTQLLTDQQAALQQQQQQDLHEIDPTLLLTSDQQMLTNEDGTPLLVTGEDGTVYQVAGKNAEGQTILVTQGPDGEQQFAYVAAAEGEENPVLTLDTAVAEAVAQLPPDQQAEALAAAAGEGQYLVKTTQEDGTTQVVTMSEAELAQHQATALAQQQQQQVGGAAAAATGQLCIQTGDGSDGQEANIPAEVVQADLPSPGGTRRVVLLLQDGTFMMTEMHDDEFKALNIAA